MGLETQEGSLLVQAGRTWDKQLNSRVVSDGLAATPKDPAVYEKNTWDWEDFRRQRIPGRRLRSGRFWEGTRGVSERGRREARDY